LAYATESLESWLIDDLAFRVVDLNEFVDGTADFVKSIGIGHGAPLLFLHFRNFVVCITILYEDTLCNKHRFGILRAGRHLQPSRGRVPVIGCGDRPVSARQKRSEA
jgi:hypothetical protein